MTSENTRDAALSECLRLARELQAIPDGSQLAMRLERRLEILKTLIEEEPMALDRGPYVYFHKPGPAARQLLLDIGHELKFPQLMPLLEKGGFQFGPSDKSPEQRLKLGLSALRRSKQIIVEGDLKANPADAVVTLPAFKPAARKVS